MAKEEEIGKIIHFYDHISVAVVALKKALKVGDTIHLVGHGGDFTQVVASMQIEHKSVEKAAAKSEIAIKVDQPVKRHWKIYRQG